MAKPLNILTIWTVFLGLFNLCNSQDSLTNHAFTDQEYKFSIGAGSFFFEISEPEELAYTYKVSQASFSPKWNTTWHQIGLVPAIPAFGCGYYDNHEEVENKIALIERGECSFVSKAIQATRAGAVACLVMGETQDNDDMYIFMQHDKTDRKVSIPSGYLLGKNGHVIKDTLAKLNLDEVRINVPINITNIPMHKIHQPPWVIW